MRWFNHIIACKCIWVTIIAVLAPLWLVVDYDPALESVSCTFFLFKSRTNSQTHLAISLGVNERRPQMYTWVEPWIFRKSARWLPQERGGEREGEAQGERGVKDRVKDTMKEERKRG